MKDIVLEKETIDRDRMYWKKKLSGEVAELRLPFDQPRPAISNAEYGTYDFGIGSHLHESIKTLSEFEQVSTSTLMMTIFIALLHRYSGEEDICIGLFTSENGQMVLRTQVQENLSFRNMLQAVKRNSEEAFAHPGIPVNDLIDRDNPVFNVQLDIQQTNPHTINNQLPRVDLMLKVNVVEDCLSCSLVYDRELFEMETMIRLEGHFNNLLTGVIDNPETPISKLSMITAKERNQLLVEWNQSTVSYPRDTSVDQQFEEQVALFPDKVALIYEDLKVTYDELNKRANQIANYLRKLGVLEGQLVAICLERSPDLIASFLGVLKAGAAYVPIDLSYPPGRISYMLEDSSASFIITKESILSSLPIKKSIPVCLDKEAEKIASQSDQNILNGRADNLAYVMYTSGSTGKPKGVMVEHLGIIRLVKNTSYVKLGPEETILNRAPIAFDVSVFEIYGALLNGSRLVIMKSHKPTFSEIAHAIQKNRVTILRVGPGMLNILLEDYSEKLESLQQVLCGGETQPVWLASKFLSTLKKCKLINSYGPTENAVNTTCHHVQYVLPHQGSIPIGRPICNDKVYILDNHLQPVPIGVIGELYVSGDGVARGYLDQVKLTKEVFIPNIFSKGEKGNLYKTGDLTYYRSDGNIEFIGRIDDQVKIRGARIELGEIETMMSSFPGVKQSVAKAVNIKNQTELVGYVVMNKGEMFDQKRLRSHVLERLAEHMVPTFFMELEEIPVTPVGKINRDVLPTPTVNRLSEITPPKTKAEKQLIQLWEEILDIQPIGIKDSYFELGGNSLLAMQMFAKIYERFGSHLPISIIFEDDTIEKLAKHIDGDHQKLDDHSLVSIQTRGIKPPLFCIHGGGGEVLVYKELANKLGRDQPLYGLRFSRRIQGENISVENLATNYIHEIRKKQPTGPYYLFGYCFGGAIAYEIAQQLIQDGEEIASLTILNFANPKRQTIEVRNEINYKRVISNNLRLLFKMPLKKRLSFFSRKVTNAIKLAKGDSETAAPIDELTRVRMILGKAIKIYKPKPYPNDILLLRANEYEAFEENLGWQTIKGGNIWEYNISAKHELLLKEPHVDKIITYLKKYLS